MEEIDYSPWKVVNTIGEGSFGKVYEIERHDYGTHVYRAALKVISVPQNEEEKEWDIANGISEKSLIPYYQSCVEKFSDEIQILSEMKGHTNIVNYEDHKVVPHKDGIGADIYIRMELLTSLNEHLKNHSLSEKEVIKLGMDMCRALQLCEKKNVVHRDIKPANIFISGDGDYKLGDFGIARTMYRTVSAMSIKGTPNYMAPEIYKGQEYGHSADIYSLGLVLYQLMNGGRLPFISEIASISDVENAFGKRMRGDRLPAPENGNKEFSRIILKACAFLPKNRYQSASEMLDDLRDLFDRHGLMMPKKHKRFPRIAALIGLAFCVALTFYIVLSGRIKTVGVYRFFDSANKGYYYTTDGDKKDLTSENGWKKDGIYCYVPDSKKGIPVYCIFNPNATEYIYTTSRSEVDDLLEAGWKRKGICWYSYEKPYDDTEALKPSDATHYPYRGALPVYRDYNPNAFANNHYYTTSKKEHDKLVKEGWQAEGIAWYCIKTGNLSEEKKNTDSSLITSGSDK